MVFLANQSRFLCCLQYGIHNCTCIDTAVHFLHHTLLTLFHAALLYSPFNKPNENLPAVNI